MQLNQSNFFKEIKKLNYFEKNSIVAVAVSGGIDSISLVFLLSKWFKLKKIKIIALIVDHKLRKNSSKEAKNVSNYLFSIGIDNKIITLKKKISISSGLQKNARLARLGALKRYCNKNNIIHLFLGHHYDDNLETFTIRKMAASNLEGLNSIKLVSMFKNIIIYRPLLKFTKKQIIFFAKRNNINYVEDPSNQDITFSRTKVRILLNHNSKIKENLKNQFSLVSKLHRSYLEMIYYNMVKIISFSKSNEIEINRPLFKILPNNIGLKILAISVLFVHNNSLNIRYKKLRVVYFNLIKKINKIRSQNTFFISNREKILIYRKNNNS